LGCSGIVDGALLSGLAFSGFFGLGFADAFLLVAIPVSPLIKTRKWISNYCAIPNGIDQKRTDNTVTPINSIIYGIRGGEYIDHNGMEESLDFRKYAVLGCTTSE